MKLRFLLMLSPLLVIAIACTLGQVKPGTSGEQDRSAVRKLARELNAEVESGDARGIRRLMYVPEHDYDFTGMQRYLAAVSAGEFKDWRFKVLHAEVEGEYAAVVISQEPPDGSYGEITPVAMFKPAGRWRVLPFDLRKDHPEIGGQDAATAYAALLERVNEWVRANTDAEG